MKKCLEGIVYLYTAFGVLHIMGILIGGSQLMVRLNPTGGGINEVVVITATAIDAIIWLIAAHKTRADVETL